MKSFFIALVILSSVSAFAKVTCQTIVENQSVYSCEFAHYVSMGNGMKAGISGCMMEFNLSPASETLVEIENKSVRVSHTVSGQLVFSERIKSNGSEVDGFVTLPNGTTIQCSGINELKY